MPATKTTGYARVAIAILRNRIECDGPKGVSTFCTTQEPRMCRAVRRLISRGVFARTDGPRGEIRVQAGPEWVPAEADTAVDAAVPAQPKPALEPVDVWGNWVA